MEGMKKAFNQGIKVISKVEPSNDPSKPFTVNPSPKYRTHSNSGNQILVVPIKVQNQQPRAPMFSIFHRNIH
jgi:hypothetical protein